MDYRQLAAGVVSGGLSTIICHPIDLIKVRMQMDLTTRDLRQTMSFTNTFRMVKNICKEHGFCSLYVGLSANTVGAMSSWGLYFMFYEYLKGYYGNMASAALAGATVQLITNPVWMAKSRLCAQLPNKVIYSGLVDCLKKVYRQSGLRGIYKGLLPGLAGVSHGAIHFTIYEDMKSRLRPIIQNDIVYLPTSSVLSKIGAVAVTYPFQVVRTRVQVLDNTNLISVCRGFFQKEGFLGMYKGIGPTILRILPSSCITLVTYEYIIKSLMSWPLSIKCFPQCHRQRAHPQPKWSCKSCFCSPASSPHNYHHWPHFRL